MCVEIDAFCGLCIIMWHTEEPEVGRRDRIVENVNVDLRDLIDFIVAGTNRH